MKDIKQKLNSRVMGLAEEDPFPGINNLPVCWYQKDHWILNDKYIFGVAMVHDFKDGGKIKYAIANRYTGQYLEGRATSKYYDLFECAIAQIEKIF